MPPRKLVERPDDWLDGPAELKAMGLGGKNAQQALIDREVIPPPMILGPATRRWWHSEILAALAQLRRGKGELKRPKADDPGAEEKTAPTERKRRRPAKVEARAD